MNYTVGLYQNLNHYLFYFGYFPLLLKGQLEKKERESRNYMNQTQSGTAHMSTTAQYVQ